MPNTNYAELYQTPTGQWMCRYTFGPIRAKVLKLFGTADLPTNHYGGIDFDGLRDKLRLINDENWNTVYTKGKP